MKYIAVFLILNVLLLSAVAGKTAIQRRTATYCTSNTQKDCCGQQKKSASDDCSKGACNAMLSCGTCGFIVAASISLSPAMLDLNRRTSHHFAVGELSDYHGNDWNPPKS